MAHLIESKQFLYYQEILHQHFYVDFQETRGNLSMYIVPEIAGHLLKFDAVLDNKYNHLISFSQ